MDVNPSATSPGGSNGPSRAQWAALAGVLAALLALMVWLVWADSPVIRYLVRVYRDKTFLRDQVASWGWAAPVVFIAIQALQVIVSPIPGEVTGPVGGALFGLWLGLFYSSVGLTIGTLVCFWVGRRWGEPLVRRWVSDRHWNRLRFILETEGRILCFVLYAIPGFPKDIISYVFGMSGMPFWVFAALSTLGRLPGTWIGTYFGAHVAEQRYTAAVVFIAAMAAVALPLYYYRERILGRFIRRKP